MQSIISNIQSRLSNMATTADATTADTTTMVVTNTVATTADTTLPVIATQVMLTRVQTNPRTSSIGNDIVNHILSSYTSAEIDRDVEFGMWWWETPAGTDQIHFGVAGRKTELNIRMRSLDRPEIVHDFTSAGFIVIAEDNAPIAMHQNNTVRLRNPFFHG